MKRDVLIFPVMALLLALPLLAGAENSTKQAGYTVHHNALPTAMLTPEVAGNYRIVRSKYRGLLNVSVIRDEAGTTGTPVTADVNATATSLIGKIHEIPMREVREAEAIYYIGDYPIVDNETLTFSLEVTPEGLGQPIKSTLKQQFFID